MDKLEMPMKNDDMYKYISGLCKKKKLRIDEFADLCGLSKTTLYRYMKGILQMPPSIEAAFAKALSMDDAERKELRRFISLNVFDSTLISSRYTLDKFIFNTHPDQVDHVEIPFAFYEDDSYLRNDAEVLETILKYSACEDFRCKIRIINCISDGMFESAKRLLDTVLPVSNLVSAEHLLIFPKKDYLECTKTLIDIIPLLRHKGYNVFYSELSIPEKSTAFLNDVVLIEISYKEEMKKHQHYYIISYLNKGLSQCVSFENKHLFNLFIGNYESYKSGFNNSLIEAKDLNALSDILLDLEMNNDQCLIKPNCCYNKIPLLAYQGLFRRMTNDELNALVRTLFVEDEDTQKCVNILFSTMQTRFDRAFKKGNIDVYSKSGLEQLAKYGRLTDHIDNMPPFNICERKMIFECLREKMTQTSNDYSLYITNKNMLESGCIISAYRNSGILIEYSDRSASGTCYNVFINNKMLSEIFFDYAENHVPAYHALSNEEAVGFIDRLIQKYLSE